MMRISMEKRFKIGTAFNIILMVFFGFVSVYHIYLFDLSIRSNLENDIRLFLTTEKNVRDCHALRQRANELIFSDNNQRPEAAKNTLKFRDDSLEYLNQISTIIASESNLLESATRQIRLLTGQEIASGEFAIRRSEIAENLQKIATELLYMRNRSLTILTARKDAISHASRNFENRIILIVVLTAVIAFIALFFLSHQIKLPTRKIIEIIRKIRDGNYAIPVRSHTGNEVDQIVSGLSTMAENLRIRDQLKLDKIQLEKKRFAALANFLNVPVMMINDEKKIAFANDELMTLFKVTLDELYEVDFAQAPIPVELREKVTSLINEKKWVDNEQCDIIGENYAFDLHLSLIPVKSAENPAASVIVTLGRIDSRKRLSQTLAKA